MMLSARILVFGMASWTCLFPAFGQDNQLDQQAFGADEVIINDDQELNKVSPNQSNENFFNNGDQGDSQGNNQYELGQQAGQNYQNQSNDEYGDENENYNENYDDADYNQGNNYQNYQQNFQGQQNGQYQQNDASLFQQNNQLLKGETQGQSDYTNTTNEPQAIEAGDLADPGQEGVPGGPVAGPNQFSGAPPVPGSRRIMATGEAPIDYIVELGDTLFDICDQLIDEADYWPKLWALNPEIKNPHFIYPGMRLRFYPGDRETPPFLEVVEESDIVPIDDGGLDGEQLLTEDLVTFNERFEPRSTEVIGPDQLDLSLAIEDNLSQWGTLFSRDGIEVHVPGFIYEDQVESVAVVVAGTNGQTRSADDEQVILNVGDDIQEGALYTVLRPSGKVFNFNSGRNEGYLYYLSGAVKVERILDGGQALARVTQSHLGVGRHDMVVPYTSTKRKIPDGVKFGPLANADASIIAFENKFQSTGGEGNFAFIDLGSEDGVQSGQSYQVFQAPGYWAMRNTRVELPVDQAQRTARLYIIDATPRSAVGYISQSSSEIRLGDRLTDEG